MSKVRRIDWSPSEWLAGTRGIGIDETAVYITVLNIIYDRGNACPNDAGWIAGQFREERRRHRKTAVGSTVASRTAAALARLIEMGKLKVSPDGGWLTNGRADIELGKAGERIVGAARAGYASGAVRRAKSPRRAPQEPSQSPARAPFGTSQSSNSNGLGRTDVRIIQPSTIKDHDTVPTISTDAARDPAPDQTAPGRAPAKSRPTLEQLAAKARARLLKGEP